LGQKKISVILTIRERLTSLIGSKIMSFEEQIYSEIEFYVRDFHDLGYSFSEDAPYGLIEIVDIGNYEDDEEGIDKDLFGYRIEVLENLIDVLNDESIPYGDSYSFHAWFKESTRDVELVYSHNKEWEMCLKNIAAYLVKYCEVEFD